MDSAIDSSIGNNNIIPFRKQNCNTNDVLFPIIEIISDQQAPFLTKEIKDAIQIAGDELIQISSNFETIVELHKSVDPFYNAIHKRSKYKFNREYYDIRTLDLQLGLIPEFGVILSFSSLFTQYLEEKKCKLILTFIGGEINDKNFTDTPDIHFFNNVSRKLNVIKTNNNLDFELIDDRWEEYEKLYSNEGNRRLLDILPVDVILHVESPIGRGIEDTGERDSLYDHEFLEPVIKGLSYLKVVTLQKIYNK